MTSDSSFPYWDVQVTEHFLDQKIHLTSSQHTSLKIQFKFPLSSTNISEAELSFGLLHGMSFSVVTDYPSMTCTSQYKVSEKELYNFKFKRFRNARHGVTSGIPVSRDKRSVDFSELRTKVPLRCSTVALERHRRLDDLAWLT
jgi:hypothetical protein